MNPPNKINGYGPQLLFMLCVRVDPALLFMLCVDPACMNHGSIHLSYAINTCAMRPALVSGGGKNYCSVGSGNIPIYYYPTTGSRIDPLLHKVLFWNEPIGSFLFESLRHVDKNIFPCAKTVRTESCRIIAVK